MIIFLFGNITELFNVLNMRYEGAFSRFLQKKVMYNMKYIMYISYQIAEYTHCSHVALFKFLYNNSKSSVEELVNLKILLESK